MAGLDPATKEKLRLIPAIDEVLARPAIVAAMRELPRGVVTQAVRALVDEARARLRGGDETIDIGVDALAGAAALRARWRGRAGTERAINATGVILHTGLGRAPLAAAAIAAVEAAAGYCLLEIDPLTGERQHRESRVAERLVRLTGAEAATVVNNNAAAVMIALAAVARGGEVIVSRGELIEIGGSFRIPQVMEESGCKLVEVGCTNRVHEADYVRAITPATRALLKVWPSNYRVIGFHQEVPASRLVELARPHGLPVLEDLGSGVLVDFKEFGLPPEPPAGQSIAAGVDLVTFSGDKLLGGAQAGILVGKQKLIEAVRRHPLFRALRPDKLCLAALDATLAITESGAERAMQEIPVLAMLAEPLAAVAARAHAAAASWRQALSGRATITVEASVGRLGSGALPEHDVPSHAVVLDLAEFGGNVDDVHVALRTGATPIFARVHGGRLLFDMRTVREMAEAETIGAALSTILPAPM